MQGLNQEDVHQIEGKEKPQTTNRDVGEDPYRQVYIELRAPEQGQIEKWFLYPRLIADKLPK